MEVKSLVGYGVSSDSEEEDEGESSTQTEKEKEAEAEGERKTQNFQQELVSAASVSSSESEREEDQEKPVEAVYLGVLNSETLLPSPFSAFSHKLTPPPLGGGSLGGFPAGISVFANPFKERAEARLNVLQKHVPLTLQARPIQIGRKRICVAYRKDGRCRFGIRCKFAHDSELQSSTGFPMEPAGSDIGPLGQTKSNPDSLRSSDYRTSALERGKEEKEEEEEEEESRKRKKHRVGLSDTLIPPKRMLKQYAMQKNKL